MESLRLGSVGEDDRGDLGPGSSARVGRMGRGFTRGGDDVIIVGDDVGTT